MGSYTNQSPLTLPVHNLAKARAFYLSALEPLAYCIVSQVRHSSVQGSFPNSDAIGLGPIGTNRVDIFLSQSHSLQPAVTGVAHVVFPAFSRAAVREVYAAALTAGAAPLARPADEAGNSGVFAATVIDPDGNRVEVAFSDQQPDLDLESQVSSRGPSIQHWRAGVASASGSSEHTTIPAHMPNATVTAKTGPQPARSTSQAQRFARQASPSRVHSNGNYTNAVVGTAIGAAAGAALAYTMFRSKNDSVGRDHTFASRMDARQRQIKDEAWAHQRDLEHDMNMPPRRSSHVDRDSGYYSERSPKQYEWSPTRSQRRSIIYSSQEAAPSRGRNSEYKMIEYRPRPASPESQRDSPRRRSSVRENSESTVRPVRRSASTAGAREYDMVRYENSAPSMPPLPATRSRRDSRSSETYSSRRRSEVLQIEGPPSSYPDRRRSEVQRPDSRSRDAPPSRRSSVQTARRVPLPASIASSGVAKSALPPFAPPSAASAALTAKALADKDRADGPGSGSRGGRLDDLRTIVPDDSISCAPTNYPDAEPSERRDRGSRTAKTRSRTSRTSRRDDRLRSGIVAG